MTNSTHLTAPQPDPRLSTCSTPKASTDVYYVGPRPSTGAEEAGADKPHHGPDPSADMEAGVGAGNQPGRDTGSRLQPTTRVSAGQLFYLLGFNGIGSFIVSGGVNFGIACAMYLTTSDPITLFSFPNTLAGDAALTLVIQPIVTWFIESLMVNIDLRNSKVTPLALPMPPSSRLRVFFGLPPTEHQPVVRRVSFISQLLRIFFLFILPSFILFWPISIGILTAIGKRQGKDWVFEGKWGPMIFKLVLGALQGMIVTPIMAAFWVVREGHMILEGEAEE